MLDACDSTLVIPAEDKGRPQVSGLHLGAVIVLTCAACVTTIELFLIEIWPRHGVLSLLLFVVPLIAGVMVARLLPERYYRVKPFESSGRIYEMLGIRFFKRFVPNGDYVNQLIRRSRPGYRVVCDKESMARFEAGTRLAERLHVGSLVLALPCIAYAVMLGWNRFALWLLLPNIAFHVYPVLLQRYTRGRILTILARRTRKR